MRSAWVSLAAGSGTVGPGDKQAVAGSRGRGRSLRRDFSRPPYGCRRGLARPRGPGRRLEGLFPGGRAKQLPRKAFEVAETWTVPMPAKRCGPELAPEPARRA